MRRLVHLIAGLLKAMAPEPRVRAMLLVTIAGFVASRIIYHAAGVRFEAFENDHLLHFISKDLFRDDLLRSLWYLHTQPPFFNFFIGVVVKLFPASTTAAFLWFFAGVGLLLTVSVYLLMVRMGVSRTISALLTLLFTASPACILFENILLYTYFTAAFLCLAALFLHRFFTSGRVSDGVFFFSLLALVILTRSLFHPAWFVVNLLMLIIIGWQHRKKIVLAATVPLLVVLLLYAKNAYLFGSFSSSSWLGMSFSKMTTFRLSEDERIDLVRKGEISELALLPPFKAIWFYDQYVTIPEFEKTGIPILDLDFYPNVGNNWNNLSFIGISRQYMDDALFVLRTYPMRYIGSVYNAFRIFFFPASDWFPIYSSIDNTGKIKAVVTLYNVVCYGQVFGFPRPEPLAEHHDEYFYSSRNMGFFLIAGYLIAVIYGAFLVFRAMRKRAFDLPKCATVLFILLTTGFVTVVGNLLEIGENERFRFNIDPLLLVMLSVFISDAAAFIRRGNSIRRTGRKGKREGSARTNRR